MLAGSQWFLLANVPVCRLGPMAGGRENDTVSKAGTTFGMVFKGIQRDPDCLESGTCSDPYQM